MIAIRRKTANNTMTAIYVDECHPFLKMNIRIHSIKIGLLLVEQKVTDSTHSPFPYATWVNGRFLKKSSSFNDGTL